jgi:hypothetical protein
MIRRACWLSAQRCGHCAARLAATLPRFGDLRPGESRMVYVAGLVVLSGLAAVVAFAERAPEDAPSPAIQPAA